MAEKKPANARGHLGHNLIPTLPTSVRWRAVVELLAGGAAADEVVAATAEAAERQLRVAQADPVYVEAVRLLFLIPVAAQNAAFGDALRQLGLAIGNEPDLTGILFAAGDGLDRIAREHGRGSDFGEISRRALMSALSSRISADLPGFFDANPTEIRRATARFGYPAEFTRLARSFYMRLLSETLSSFLDRTLAQHVGPGERFAHLGERAAFDTALQQYCLESTRIIHEFSRGWHAKHLLGRGIVPRNEIAGYAAFALTKITLELQRRRGLDG